jgi:hypothetical protein
VTVASPKATAWARLCPPLQVFDAGARCTARPPLPIAPCAAPIGHGLKLGFCEWFNFEEFDCEGCTMTKPQGTMPTLRRWALVPFATLALAACGGGDADAPQAGLPPGPATFAVAPPPATPATPGDSTGATESDQTGPLHYMVFSASNVATGIPVQDLATISRVGVSHDITFPAAGAFALTNGLVIHLELGTANLPKWNTVSNNGGILNSADTFSGAESGLINDGNILVYCSAGLSYELLGASHPEWEPSARAGAQVAVSGNFVAMSDIAALYGKTFKRFDCTNSAPSAKFGDGNGSLTMAFGPTTLSPADVVAAFSSAGFTSAGATYKRRAYQITIRGVTRYVIVALDKDAAGNPTSSVLY